MVSGGRGMFFLGGGREGGCSSFFFVFLRFFCVFFVFLGFPCTVWFIVFLDLAMGHNKSKPAGCLSVDEAT